MAQTSFAMMTTLGRAKEAAALANATTITITQIAIGEGVTVPSGGETALYHEVARKTVSGHGTVAGAANVAYFDCYLAAGDGPYSITEAGLYDVAGDLIAIAHYDPPINKPVPSSGQTVEGTVRLEVAFSDVANVTIVVDPSMQVALQRLTRLPWIPIISMTLAIPPVNPVPGDTYLIAAGPTGAWTGQAGKIAEYTIAGWAIITPPDGHGVSLPDGRIFERIGGTYVQKIANDVQGGTWTYTTAGGTANALTATFDPPLAAIPPGMVLRLKIAATNTLTNPTMNVGSGDIGVVWADGTPIKAGDLIANTVVTLIYNNSFSKWTMIGLSPGQAIAASSQVDLLAAYTTPGTYTFTAPADGLYVFEVWGAGGGGGWGGTSGFGSGGSSGAYVEGAFKLTAGQNVTVGIGSGGAAGFTGPADGSSGGLSRLTISGVNYDVPGGIGGKSSTSGNADATSMTAEPTWGRRRLRGSIGTIGRYVQSPNGGDGGPAPFGGSGGAGGFQGTSGIAPGGGGGACGNDGTAAAGAPGGCRVWGRTI